MKTGRFDADNLNPPLSRVWSALPLAVMGTNLGDSSAPNDATALGDHFIIANAERYDSLFAWGRILNLTWSVLTGLLIVRWGSELFGASASLIGAALWFFCPIVVSNAALVTPDISTAFFFLAVPYATWKWAHHPTIQSAIIVGVFLGLAQLAKFTSVLLYPVVVIEWAILRLGTDLMPASWRRIALQGAAAIATSLFVLNAGYLFQGTGRALGDYDFRGSDLKLLQKTVGSFGRAWFPFPKDYLEGFDRQRSIMEAQHPVFLDGNWSLGSGFPDYFARACAYKMPHAAQLIIVCGLFAFLLTRKGRREWRTLGTLLIPAGLVFAVASGSSMQLGIRYMLPAFPLLYLMGSKLGADSAQSGWKLAKLAPFVCIPALAFGLRYHPNHLAYFNELSGGPINGGRHLLDSNIDWGQDLKTLRKYLRENQIDDVGLAYFGMIPPARIGINYHLPPTITEWRQMGRIPSGWYAISVNFVEGRPHTIRDYDDEIHGINYEEFGYFRRLTPIARLGWSINVYQVEYDR